MAQAPTIPAGFNQAADDAAGSLLAAIETGDTEAFLFRYAHFRRPPLPRLLSAAIAHDATGIAVFLAGESGRGPDMGMAAASAANWMAAAKNDNVTILEALHAQGAPQSATAAAGRATAGFEIALENGCLNAAGWLADTYPVDIDPKYLRATATAAMQAEDAAVALFAIRKIEDQVPPSNDILRRLYNSLMDDSIRHGFTQGIDYLFGKSQVHYASGMAAAAHYNQTVSLRHFLDKASGEGYDIPKIDLETTLSLAAEHRADDVIGILLQQGVNPHVHNDKLLRKAIDRYTFSGFAPVRIALDYGANALLALDYASRTHPADLALQQDLKDYIARHLPKARTKQARIL